MSIAECTPHSKKLAFSLFNSPQDGPRAFVLHIEGRAVVIITDGFLYGVVPLEDGYSQYVNRVFPLRRYSNTRCYHSDGSNACKINLS